MTATAHQTITFTYAEAIAKGGPYAREARKAVREGRPVVVNFTSGRRFVFTIDDVRVLNTATGVLHRADCTMARTSSRSAAMGVTVTSDEAPADAKRCGRCHS